jgi:hypothetical protein
MSEEKAQEEVKKEEEKTPAQGVAEALSKFEGAPTSEQIEGWKQEFGEVFCSAFSEEELLIFRPVNRGEFVKMQTDAANAERPWTQLDMEGVVSEMCLLWASDNAQKSLRTKAGSLSTLHEWVMANSNFMDPRIASALVIKL